MFFVRCAEVVPSPCCGEKCNIIGSRKRIYIEATGEKKELRIRRLRCSNCRRIHHELPDFLVPHKHYESACVEQTLTEEPVAFDVAADNATLQRWKAWFRDHHAYWLGCLASITLRFHQAPVKAPSNPSQTAHHTFGQIVGEAPGWLARIVRPIANANLWLHTRFAYLTKSPFGRLDIEV